MATVQRGDIAEIAVLTVPLALLTITAHSARTPNTSRITPAITVVQLAGLELS